MLAKLTTIVSENKASFLKKGLIIGGVAAGLTLAGVMLKKGSSSIEDLTLTSGAMDAAFGTPTA